MITVLAGGVGAARYLRGQLQTAEQVTAIVNTGDDIELHGLHVSPDIDTIIYTLSGQSDNDRGWGLCDETWTAFKEAKELGLDAWFQLGDRDIGTHLARTSWLQEGMSLSEVTTRLATARAVKCRVLPMSNDPVRTHVTLAAEGREVGFQEYFVQLGYSVPISGVRFAGADVAKPAPGVLDAVENADVVVIAPSNPVVSVGPILALDGIYEALSARKDRNIAISPLIGGKALKGPAARMMTELGERADAVGVARRYRDIVSTLVIDEVDGGLVEEVESVGVRAVVAPTIMSSLEAAVELARVTVASVS